MSDDSRQKMKTFLHKVRRILPSPRIAIGIVLSGLILWYLLFGSCGYVSVKASIKNMNTIFEAWQTLRARSIPGLSVEGIVSFETITMMEEWRTLAYTLQVPSCLGGTRSTLIDAIESDYQTFHLAQDRISIDQKLQYIASNEAIFDRYLQKVNLIEACAPLCNVNTP
jgi:hypothetical protein